MYGFDPKEGLFPFLLFQYSIVCMQNPALVYLQSRLFSGKQKNDKILRSAQDDRSCSAFPYFVILSGAKNLYLLLKQKDVFRNYQLFFL